MRKETKDEKREEEDSESCAVSWLDIVRRGCWVDQRV